MQTTGAQRADFSGRFIRIMALGDSITEGGSTFSAYTYPLWEKLYAGGYQVEFVGSRTIQTRTGEFKNEGRGGWNAESIAQEFEKNFPNHIADVLLIHCGHNHEADEKPIPAIVAANASMIATARRSNPQIYIFLAQVIPSGKLPKYRYLPELNIELKRLAEKLDTPVSRVIAVDQATGFDWRTDTIEDHVHPNALGAEKIASRWFEAVARTLPRNAPVYQPEIIAYKKIGDSSLILHIFKPEGGPRATPRPAIVFFFGGGWVHGTPLQFYPECAHFASKGFVAITADYRIKTVDDTTPFESDADGKSAIRWVRAHAHEWGIDPHRIAAAGASAGGQVAAFTALVPGQDDPADDLSISAQSNALLVWYGVVDNGPEGYGPPEMKARYAEISPRHNIADNPPPCLFLLGTSDEYVPVKTAEAFQAEFVRHGGRCDLHLFPGAHHPLYPYRDSQAPLRSKVLSLADQFLDSIGFVP